MTAAEIYSIVKDVPREAWPRGIGYSGALQSFEHAQERTHTIFDDEHAETLFVGSMLAWLGTDEPIEISRDDNCWWVRFGKLHKHYPTLLEALAAACKGVV